MAKQRNRSWILVGLLLVGAVLMTLGLVFPEWFGDEAQSRQLEIAGGLAGRGPAAAADRAADAGAVPRANAAAGGPAGTEELPPYGNRDLAQEKAIRGVVRDKDGQPVPDAIVIAVFREWRAHPHTVVTAGKVRTEPDGVFVLGPLERREYWIVASKRGAGVAYAASQMPGAWLEMALAPGASVTGTVTARAGGAPVAGAKIVVKDWNFWQEAETDEAGKYTLASLPATANTWQGQQVVVVAEGFKIAQRSNLLLKAGAASRVDFALEVGATLTGRVVNARTLQPIAGAVVGEGWEPYHRTVTTDAEGNYALANVDTAPNTSFTARADGFLPQQQESDGTGRLAFALDASLRVHGVVQDRNDNPVPGARVYLHRVRYEPGFEPAGKGNNAKTFATADASGAFAFDDVLPGQVAVIAFHRAHAPGEKGPVTVALGGAAAEPVTVTMKEGLTVEGEVRDLQDNPLPDIRVQLQRWWGGRLRGYKYAMNYIWSEMPIWYTDKRGKFKLTGALEGKHWLSAYDQTYGWTGTRVEGVAGQRLTDVVISFAGATIEGVFKTADGEPVAGAAVQARGPKNTPRPGWRWTQTDGLGRFKLGGLKDGSYDITGSSGYGNPKPLKDVPAGTTTVVLTLQGSQVLVGEASSARTGRVLERFYLTIQPYREPGARRNFRSRGANWAGWIDSPDGTFERPLTAGVYNLTFKAAGHAPRTIERVVVEAHIAPTRVFARLDAGSGIHGVLRDIEGKPMRGQWITAQVYRAPGETRLPSDWLMGGRDRSDSNGRFFIEGVAPGVYLLQLNLGKRGSAIAQVTVSGSEMVRQNLQLLPTGYVVFTVKDGEGKPVPGVYFTFFDESGNYVGWASQTNNRGQSRSGPLPMGAATARAWVQNDAYAIEPVTVKVQPGKTLTVEVGARKK